MNGQIISIPNLQILVKSSHFMLPPVSVGQGMEEAGAGWDREAVVGTASSYSLGPSSFPLVIGIVRLSWAQPHHDVRAWHARCPAGIRRCCSWMLLFEHEDR